LYHIDEPFASETSKKELSDNKKRRRDKTTKANDKLNILFIIKKGSIVDFQLVLWYNFVRMG
jgi:hypothetical protein